MRKILLTSVCLVLACVVLESRAESVKDFMGKLWTVGRDGDFLSIDEAMQSTKVNDGDILFVNQTSVYQDATITKRVCVLGTGNDATIRLSATVRVKAKGAMLTGLHVNQIELYNSHVVIERCYVNGSIHAADGCDCDWAKIIACLIEGNVDGNENQPAVGWTLQNNAMVFPSHANVKMRETGRRKAKDFSFVVGNLKQATINHNLIATRNSGQACIVNAQQTTIKNNILLTGMTTAPLENCTGSTVTHNYLSPSAQLPDDNQFEPYLGPQADMVIPDLDSYVSMILTLYKSDHYADDGTSCGPGGGQTPLDTKYIPTITPATTAELVLDPAITLDWSNFRYQTLQQLMNGLPDARQYDVADVAVADGTYEMTCRSFNPGVPDQPTYADMEFILTNLQADVNKFLSEWQYMFPSVVSMHAPTGAVFRFYVFGEELKEMVMQGIQKVQDVAQQTNLHARWMKIQVSQQTAVYNVFQKMKLENIKVFCDDRLLIGKDDFRVSSGDLLALKQIYFHLGGSSWTNKKWNFVNNGTVREDFPGVTFSDEGRVTAIDLENNGLTGELSALFSKPQFSELVTLNLSRNRLTGDISTFVTNLTALQTVDLSYNQLTEMTAGLPPTWMSADLRFQNRVWNDGMESGLAVTDDFSELTPIELDVVLQKAQPVQLPSLFTLLPGSVYSLYLPTSLSQPFCRLNENAEGTGFCLELSDHYGIYNLEQDARVVLILESGLAGQSAYPVVLHFLPGDADMNGVVDIADVQLTLNYLQSPETVTLFNRSAADTCPDAAIDLQDVLATVNLIMDATTGEEPADEQPEEQGSVCVRDGVFVVNAAQPVASLEIEVEGVSADEVSLMLNSADFTMVGQNTQRGARFIIFSTSGQLIPAGQSVEVLQLPAAAMIVSVQATDSKADVIGLNIESVPDAITLSPFLQEGLPVFDLQGRRITPSPFLQEGQMKAMLPRGVYIVGGRKVVIPFRK